MDMPPLTNRADEPVRTEGTQIGYASYSTREGRACLEAQVAELRRSGCQSTKSEEVDSIGDCKVLARLVRRLKCWDVLTVTKLDRLARSAREAMEIAQTLSEKGAALRILNLNLYTATPAGKQLLQVLAAAAELERTVTLNRQHERKCREMRAISRDINTCELAQAYLAHVEELMEEEEELGVEQIKRELRVSGPVARQALFEVKRRRENITYYEPLESRLLALRERLAELEKSRP